MSLSASAQLELQRLDEKIAELRSMRHNVLQKAYPNAPMIGTVFHYIASTGHVVSETYRADLEQLKLVAAGNAFTDAHVAAQKADAFRALLNTP